jgi:signal transduction histidine kinase/ActR/RegA family two-component response regulator
MPLSPHARLLLQRAAITFAAYTLAGTASLWLSGSNDAVSLMYLATGVGLAFVLGWGRLMAVPVGLGSAAVSWIGQCLASPDPMGWALWVSFIISGFGGGLQAWLAARWTMPDPQGDLRLDRPRDIVSFLVLAGPMACVFNAAISTTAMVGLGLLPAALWAPTLVSWWAGDALGVLMGTPPLLTLLARPRPLWQRRLRIMGIPMLVAMLLLAVGIRQMQRWEHEREAATFRQEVDRTATAVKLRLSGYLSALESLRGVFDASDSVERNEFSRASRPWLEQLKDVRAMGWEERLSTTRLAEFEAQQRAEGLTQYRVFDGTERQPPRGDEVVALRFIEPMEGNESALGYNVLSRPQTRQAYQRAVLDNQPSVTPPLNLMQDDARQTGVVIYRAVYRDPNALPSDRARSAAGAVFVALRPQEALHSVLKDMPSYMRACLIDVTEREPVVLSGDASCQQAHTSGSPVKAAQSLTVPLPFAQRQWALHLWAVEAVPIVGGRATSWMFATVGVLFAAALGALLLVITGTTERMAAAMSEARRQRESAEQANQAKSEFLSRMSHELRTPLNAMLGFSQVMGLDPSEPLATGQRQRLEQIQQAGWHLLDMIDDVLDLSRIDSGTLRLEVANLPLPPVLAACEPLVAELAERMDVHLTLDGTLPAGWGVQADETRLRQVITNLLSNAIKYNRPGGSVRVQAALVKNSQGPMVNLVVTDNGLGMSEQQVSQLFQPFNRLGRERQGQDGTGIGLVISRHLTQLMGGQLSVSSREGEGSTFTLSLPAASLPVQASAPPPLATASAVPTWSAHDEPTRHVLYVEDNLANSALVQAALSSRPWIRLTLAETIEDGLAALHDRLAGPAPQLILLDVHLPDASGLDFLKLAKANPETRHIPVVMISADVTPDQVNACLSAGATCYLTKPVGIADLLEQVDKLLGRRSPV